MADADDTVLVSPDYLAAMLAAAPPREPTIEEEVAAEPLPAPRDLGGMVVSSEYLRWEIVMLRRARRRAGAVL